MNNFWFLILLLTFDLHYLIGQVTYETRDKIKLTASCTVSIIENRNFLYSYRLSNSVEAKQSVWLFSVRLRNKQAINQVKAPQNWNKIISDDDMTVIEWFAKAKDDVDEFEDEVKPGDHRTGFSFDTGSLPGIVVFYAEGWADFPKFEPGMATDSIPGYSDLTPYGPGVVGKTVGPVLPPTPFVASAFLDTLISYKHQALALGWIKNEGIVQSLDAKLENAQAQLQRNNTTAAKNILQAFVNEVEALWKQERPPYGGEQITSEAYAVLKFNAEYLISKL